MLALILHAYKPELDENRRVDSRSVGLTLTDSDIKLQSSPRSLVSSEKKANVGETRSGQSGQPQMTFTRNGNMMFKIPLI